MKPFFIITLLVIFSTADAYGFLNKDKGKSVAKSKKSSQRKVSVAVEKTREPPQDTNGKTASKPFARHELISSPDRNEATPKVKKTTVDKLQLIEKQHYHGNRELLIKHLQRQIELKKKQGSGKQSTQNADNQEHKLMQEPSPKYNHLSTHTADDLQSEPSQQNNQVKRSPSTQMNGIQQQQHDTYSQQQTEIGQSQQQLTQLQNDMQHLSQQSNTIGMQQQVQLQNRNTMKDLQNLQSDRIMQQQHNQQQILNQHNMQHSQQSSLLAQQQQHRNSMNRQANQQQFMPQQQNTMQQIQQQQAISGIRQEINHIEQSFLPQQDLLQIQNQFNNRNNVQPQMQIQPMDMHKSINFLNSGNPHYQSVQSHAQFQVQQPQLRVQALQQQPNNQMSSQLHLQQQNANQASMQNQHVLMPINSISMDSLLRPKAMQPERFIIVKNSNLPTTTTPKPTTTTQKPTTTTTTTTPRPTTSKATTTTQSEQDPNVKRETRSPSMKQKYFEKEMRKQDLEIIKLELEIRALRRIEKYGRLPKELELEASRQNAASATIQNPTKTTTTQSILPFLDFGKNKLKFPFDF